MGLKKSTAKTVNGRQLHSTYSTTLFQDSSGCFDASTDALLEAAVKLALFGLLRCCEFTTRTNSFNPKRDLTISDLEFQPQFYTISLKHSKTVNKGILITIAHVLIPALVLVLPCDTTSTCNHGRISAAAPHRIPSHMITILGRWTSLAYELYLRNNVKDIISAQKMLGSEVQ